MTSDNSLNVAGSNIVRLKTGLPFQKTPHADLIIFRIFVLGIMNATRGQGWSYSNGFWMIAPAGVAPGVNLTLSSENGANESIISLSILIPYGRCR
jgi:hypothetical protein